MGKSAQDYRKYLDPAVVSKITSLELIAKLVVEGFMVGLHKSPFHGFSVEFSEHRSYMQGDPIRNIDWKVYAKTEKYFIKQYEEETNLISHVAVDVSKSMDFKNSGEITKLEYAYILAASLIYLMISQQDSVGLALYSDEIVNYIRPRSNRIQLKTLLTAINNVDAADVTRTAHCLNSVAEKIKRRGLVIIISDFFDDINSVISAIKHFHFKKNEVIVFQILDPIELNFAFGNDAVFIDKETREEITTQPFQIQKAYQLELQKFISKIRNECRSYGIDYNLIDTSVPFDKALFSYFKKRSRLN